MRNQFRYLDIKRCIYLNRRCGVAQPYPEPAGERGDEIVQRHQAEHKEEQGKQFDQVNEPLQVEEEAPE